MENSHIWDRQINTAEHMFQNTKGRGNSSSSSSNFQFSIFKFYQQQQQQQQKHWHHHSVLGKAFFRFKSLKYSRIFFQTPPRAQLK
jgi:hypothetical protein